MNEGGLDISSISAYLFKRSTPTAGIADLKILETIMLRYRFTFLVFQDGKLDEELESVLSFNSHESLIAALLAHAAQQSQMRFNPKVLPLYCHRNVPMPGHTQKGYGQATVLVIKEVVQI